MLFLNNEDIKLSITFNEVMDKIEESYGIFYRNEYYMPHRPTIEYKNKTLIYMLSFIDNLFGTKILTVFPDNMAIFDLVVSNHIYQSALRKNIGQEINF